MTMTAKFINQSRVLDLLGISRTTLFRIRQDPHETFPRPQPFRGALRWRLDDVLKWAEKNNPNTPNDDALVEKLSEVE